MEMVTLNLDVSKAAAKKCAKLAGVDFSEWQEGGGDNEKMSKFARKFFTDGLNNHKPKGKKKKN